MKITLIVKALKIVVVLSEDTLPIINVPINDSLLLQIK
jgi:hypothetical protein